MGPSSPEGSTVGPRVLSRNPSTIGSEYVALQPHLAHPPPPDRLYVYRTNRPSFSTSLCRATSPSVIPTAPTVCLSPRKSVALSVHPTDSPSVIPARPSHEPSVHPPVTPSMTRPSATPPVSLAQRQSDRPSPSDRLYTILPATVPLSVRHTNQSVRPSATVPTSVRHPHPSVRPSATVTPSVRHTNQSISLYVNSRLSDRHYDLSARTSVIPHDSPYPRLAPLPSSREWGAITHDSPYTRFEPIPSSREWGAIPQGHKIP